VIKHQELIKSIRAGKPLNCGDHAARSTLVAIMGQLSCYSGQEVIWDEVCRSEFFFAPRLEACTWTEDSGMCHLARLDPNRSLL
jgi:hypothetical protein